MKFPNSEPLARSEDEKTSHKAASELTSSGKRSTHKTELMLRMLDHGMTVCEASLTANEIARKLGLDHPMVHKRLPDLLRDGFVRKCGTRVCTVTGKDAVTWRVVMADERASETTQKENHPQQESLTFE